MVIFQAEEAKQGFYFDITNGEFVHLDEPARRQSTTQGKLIRVPAPMLVVAAPVVGVAYVMLLPFAGIAAGSLYLGYKARSFVLAISGRIMKKHQPSPTLSRT